uniref:Uncharacterized protein n=1 Tax=Lepeophtheirus salmonis TaxID=72036 RepID=A0A0K2TJD7_LEPSM
MKRFHFLTVISFRRFTLASPFFKKSSCFIHMN